MNALELAEELHTINDFLSGIYHLYSPEFRAIPVEQHRARKEQIETQLSLIQIETDADIRKTSERMQGLAGMDNHARAEIMTVAEKRVHLIHVYEFALKNLCKKLSIEWIDPCYCHSTSGALIELETKIMVTNR